jgi:hypothetical protein
LTWGQETVVFFAALRKPMPIESGDGLEFQSSDDPEPVPTTLDDEPVSIPALAPAAPDGVSLRFWQVEGRADELQAPLEAIDEVTRAVVPRFASSPNRSSPDLGASDTTVVEMATPLPKGDSSVQLAFRRCFTCVQDVSRAFGNALRPPVAPLTIGDVHPLVLFISRTPGTLGRWRLGFSIYIIPGSLGSEFLAPSELSADDVQTFAIHLRRLRQGDPFPLYAERTHLARTAQQVGEFGDAVVQTAIGVEILLDGVVALCLWEEQASLAVAARTLRRSVSHWLGNELAPRLGGSWDQSGVGAIGRWRRDLADVRNRVVHRGYRPSEEQGNCAIAAGEAVDELVRERLAKHCFQYPRTALLLLGEPGLRKRDAWTRRMQEVAYSSHEDSDSWQVAYVAWRDRVDAYEET